MIANQNLRMVGVLLLAVAGGMLLSGCRDEQEAAVNELYESEFAFNVDDFLRASKEGDLRAVRWFLEAGMDPDVADISNTRALHMAAEFGGTDVVEKLLELGVDPQAARMDGRTPLMLAAAAGDGRSVELLLDHGAKALEKDSRGWSALALAAYGGFGRAVEALVPLSRPHLNDALLLAAISGHLGSIDHLVSHEAVVDTRSPDDRTPLMLAASRGNKGAVKMLLHHGANFYATDLQESTAAELAAAGGHGEIVNLLERARIEGVPDDEGDESFVPDEAGGQVLYSSQTRRLDGAKLVGGTVEDFDLREKLQMLRFRERQLPFLLQGLSGGGAEIRLLFGENAVYHVEKGQRVPETNLEVFAIEERWVEGKGTQGVRVKVGRLVVRDTISGEVIGVTKGDPGRSAKSFALMKHAVTGQVYRARRGDRFEALGNQFRIVDLRPGKVLVEELGSGEVVVLER